MGSAAVIAIEDESNPPIPTEEEDTIKMCVICDSEQDIMTGPCNCSSVQMPVCITCFLRCVSTYNNRCPTCKIVYTINNETYSIKKKIIIIKLWRRINSGELDTDGTGKLCPVLLCTNRVGVENNETDMRNACFNYVSIFIVNICIVLYNIRGCIQRFYVNTSFYNRILKLCIILAILIASYYIGKYLIVNLMPNYIVSETGLIAGGITFIVSIIMVLGTLFLIYLATSRLYELMMSTDT